MTQVAGGKANIQSLQLNGINTLFCILGVELEQLFVALCDEIEATRDIATDLHNPDFVKLAEAYGALGRRVDTPKALAPAIRRGFGHDGPAIIEIPMGDLPSPCHLIDMPRVGKAKH